MTSAPQRPPTPDGFSSLVSLALDGMCVGLVLTGPTGRVTWMNRAAERTLGLERTEGLGQPLAQIIKDPQFGEFWRRAGESAGTLLGEVSVHWPRQAELRVNATQCLGASRDCLGRALLFCDVTHDRVVQLQLSQEATERLMDLVAQHSDSDRPQESLTAQELRVLRHVGEGLGNQQIARTMHVAPSTVRTHLKHVYAKLALASRSEAVRYALRHGL